jgi:NAD+ synthase
MDTKSFVITEQNVAAYAGKIAAWVREKVEQGGRKGVVLGLSGGIDSSVAARLCQLAKADTHLVLLPYGDDMQKTKSMDHAMEFIAKFHFPYHTFDIKPAVDALIIPWSSPFSGMDKDDVELSRANLRPRVRMTYLYEVAQLDRRFVTGTGNLAEATVGYFTKWGDGAHDLNPLARLTKKEVYALARYLGVPNSIISKQPSAGLWEGQTDEDELGITYAQIDAYILEGTSGNAEADRKIEHRRALSAHKTDKIPAFEG